MLSATICAVLYTTKQTSTFDEILRRSSENHREIENFKHDVLEVLEKQKLFECATYILPIIGGGKPSVRYDDGRKARGNVVLSEHSPQPHAGDRVAVVRNSTGITILVSSDMCK